MRNNFFFRKYKEVIKQSNSEGFCHPIAVATYHWPTTCNFVESRAPSHFVFL